jgi:hypothetical protein
MKRARALVGHIKSSSQSETLLKNLQRTDVEGSKKPLTVIQDVVTRWWSTFAMCKRLLELEGYFKIMETRSTEFAPFNLTAVEWSEILQTKTLLEPIMEIQKYLEGEKYVTVSVVPSLIGIIRRGLTAFLTNDSHSERSKNVCRLMLSSFNTHWGIGDKNHSIFKENQTEGPRRRPKGIPLNTLRASALDPRTKVVTTYSKEDRALLFDDILSLMLEIHKERRAPREEEINEENHAGELCLAPPKKKSKAHADGDHVDSILDISYVFSDDDDDNNVTNNDDPHHTTEEAEYEAGVQAELLGELNRYRAIKSLPMVDPVTRLRTNPLLWWKVHEPTFPHVAALARKFLCIPATSSPSERLFSTAGLTITKARNGLRDDNASAIIFLNKTWDVVNNWSKDCDK